MFPDRESSTEAGLQGIFPRRGKISLAAGNAGGIPVVNVRQSAAATLKGLHNAMGRLCNPLRGWEYGGWDGATGAPPALPAVNVILPLPGNGSCQLSVVRGDGARVP